MSAATDVVAALVRARKFHQSPADLSRHGDDDVFGRGVTGGILALHRDRVNARHAALVVAGAQIHFEVARDHPVRLPPATRQRDDWLAARDVYDFAGCRTAIIRRGRVHLHGRQDSGQLVGDLRRLTSAATAW